MTSPGNWEVTLAWSASLAMTLLFCGVMVGLRPQNPLPMAGLLVACGLVPHLFFVWGRRRPAKSPIKDARPWMLAAVAVVGLALSANGPPSSSWTDRLALPLMVPLFYVGSFAVYMRLRTRQRAALVKAAKTGWRLSEREIVDLGVEKTLLEEMTPRQRLLHQLVLLSGYVVFMAVAGLLLWKRAEPLDGYMALWAVFLVSTAGITAYYQRLLRGQFVQKKRNAVELDAARRMQLALLPKEDPRVEGFDIAGACLPAEEVGGDLYAFFHPPGEGAFGVAVADVSGKAMKAAMATVLLSGVLRAETRRGGGPSELLGRMNGALRGGLEPYTFVAMQVLLLDAARGGVRYGNAGQVHPLLLREGAVTRVELQAMPLGLAEDAKYEEAELVLQPGDVLVLVSDGITEAMDGSRRLFGEERLERALLSLDPSRSARSLLDSLLAEVDAFRGSAPPSDDRTVVVVKRVGK